jgi:hypothetical protein
VSPRNPSGAAAGPASKTTARCWPSPSGAMRGPRPDRDAPATAGHGDGS